MWSPTRFYLWPHLFLIDINDLRLSLKLSTASHFAGDNCIIHQSKKLKTLESKLNHDLKLCKDLLNVNRLSLNVDKTKLLIFHSKRKKIDHINISIKLNGFNWILNKQYFQCITLYFIHSTEYRQNKNTSKKYENPLFCTF